MQNELFWYQVLVDALEWTAPLWLAVVAFFIINVMDQTQWRRYTRKVLYILLYWTTIIIVIGFFLYIIDKYWGVSDGVAYTSVMITIAIGFLLVMFRSAVYVWNTIEVQPEWLWTSRFMYTLHGGPWPTLSADVAHNYLPEGVQSINGRIFAERHLFNTYRTKVTVYSDKGVHIPLDRTFNDPQAGWMVVMKTIRNAQTEHVLYHRTWIDRVPLFNRAAQKWQFQPRAPLENEKPEWREKAFMQIHRLATIMNARGAVKY